MISIQNYKKVQSLQEAYELNQKRSTRILGGMMWMRLSSGNIGTAIDLSGLGLDTIEETDTEFRIGCMCSLRSLELHPGLSSYFGGAIRESVKHIIGVQFRNGATVGGSVFGRFGFSDILTCFLALDSYVELFHGGRVLMREFAERKQDNDILVYVILKKDGRQVRYCSERIAETDFPVLACAVAKTEDAIYVSVGARPMKAKVRKFSLPAGAEDAGLRELAREAAGQFSYGSNMRGNSEYRKHLAEVDIYRNLKEIDWDR